jgi:hypothetical protein
VLNRLMLPLPLYQISDWVGQTMLVSLLKRLQAVSGLAAMLPQDALAVMEGWYED